MVAAELAVRAKTCPRCGRDRVRFLRDTWYCPECRNGGGPVQAALLAGKSLAQAIEGAGVSIPSRAVLLALRAARNEYRRELAGSSRAQDYIRQSRGILPETAAMFGLGFAPGNGLVISRLLRRGFTLEVLRTAGLVSGNGMYREHMWDRLVFPVESPSGLVMGLAGRSLTDAEPKYLNTHGGWRSQALFGIRQAAPYIAERREAWVVEGYFDVLALHQAGIRWAVSCCGTALTYQQAAVLRRYARKVLLLFDADVKREAVERAASVLRDAGLEARAATLPDGRDPDQIVLEESPEALMDIAALAEAVP